MEEERSGATEILKRTVCEAIDQNRKKISAIGEAIWKNPEMGYKEYRTADLVKEIFNGLHIPYEDRLALTGVKGTVRGRKRKASVCVIGEMDAVTCSAHPARNRETGAAHACGHHAQMAAMLGAAIGISAVAGQLDGDAIFLAVSAEEYVEIEYRQELVRQNKIRCLGGKQELIGLGAFDNVDMAMMFHAHSATPGEALYLDGGSLGFVAKTIRFAGREAHAGGAPHEGINALNAAVAALMCIHAQRETFRDEDKIRVHPIITRGGELVNIVPAEVTMETYVRGGNFFAIGDAAKKVDRAVCGASYAIGAEAEITDIAGYLPLLQDRAMGEMFEHNAKGFIKEEHIVRGVDMTGSTDIGDLSHIMPCIQPTMGGFAGTAHSREFTVTDDELAYVIPAKIMAMTVVDLLTNGAARAISVKKGFKSALTKKEYIELLNQNMKGWVS